MPHIVLWVSFSKLRRGPCHIMSEDSDLLHFMNAYKSSSFFGSTDDSKVDGAANVILDKLEERGYHVIGFTSFGEPHGSGSSGRTTAMWTLRRAADPNVVPVPTQYGLVT